MSYSVGLVCKKRPVLCKAFLQKEPLCLHKETVQKEPLQNVI